MSFPNETRFRLGISRRTGVLYYFFGGGSILVILDRFQYYHRIDI